VVGAVVDARGYGERQVEPAAERRVPLVITGLPAKSSRRILQRSHFAFVRWLGSYEAALPTYRMVDRPLLEVKNMRA
jgi:hypothetical protein